MRLLAPLLLVLLLCGCTGPERVSPAEFKRQYAWVGQAQTVKDVQYLGQRDGRAYIKISSMSTVSRKWSDHIIYVELAKLDSAFRDSLPKTEMKDTR
jgi:outer membrane biogenesis lipoprotein LolB